MSKFLDSNGLLYFWQKVKTALTGKVDKAEGKALSSNDYTDAEKSKLAGIAANANKYAHPTGDGNQHVPATGTTNGGKFLRAGETAGSAAWTGLEKADVTGALGYTPPTANTTYSPATQSANGLMSAADKKKLDGFGAASSYALKEDIVGMYKFKGSVAAYANLPTGAALGDVYNVTAGGKNYAWDGSAWDDLGGTFTVDAITNAEIDTVVAS